MSETSILLPSKPKVIKESPTIGHFEIDGLYPGYGHTLGNSLRRIILSSLPGAAITNVKIEGVGHEFTTITGVKEDVLTILLNLKKVRFVVSADENQTATLKIKGGQAVTAKDIKVPGQVTVANPDQHLFTITSPSTEVEMEITIEKGIGFVAKELIQKERVDIGSISLDAIFSPILQANYDVEQMRVGDRTDFNKLKLMIQTDGTISPKEALEKSIEIMITQLKAIIGFKEEEIISSKSDMPMEMMQENHADKEALDDVLKTRIESLDMSQRTANALVNANIRTVGGLIRKKEEDILDLPGLGQKGLDEIKSILETLGLSLKA